MIKKEYRLITVAIIIGALGIGAFLFLSSRDSESPAIIEDHSTTPLDKASQDPEMTSPTEGASVEGDQKPAITENAGPRKPTPEELAQHTDPEIEHQKKIVNDFKNLTKMNVKFPPDFKFKNLDIDDQVAGIEGVSAKGDRKLVILATPSNPTPGVIAGYLADQKGNIPALADHNFKISGKVENVEVPPGKGIAKITLIPGGEKDGTKIFAAHLQRTDGKGSYVFIMRASQNYYDNYEGEVDSMLESFSTK